MLHCITSLIDENSALNLIKQHEMEYGTEKGIAILCLMPLRIIIFHTTIIKPKQYTLKRQSMKQYNRTKR